MFTKEYIELAKNEKIQGLRPIIKVGDYTIDIYGIMEINIKDYNPDGIDDGIRKAKTWLPTGDQLDQEIAKICKEKYKDDGYYEIYYQYNFYEVTFRKNNLQGYKFKDNSNPLICKIKLLIQLLEASNV